MSSSFHRSALLSEGAFGPGGCAAVLRDTVRLLADGRLDVVCGPVKRSVWVEAGQVRAVASEAEEEKLGQWLVTRDVIKRHQMACALLSQPDATLFGQHLVGGGALSVFKLQQELYERAVHLLGRLLISSGRYRFKVGELFPRDALVFETTTAGLIAAAVRDLGPSGNAFAALLAPANRFPWPAADALMLFQKASLTEEEARVFARVDGTTTGEALRAQLPDLADRVPRALGVLVAAGLVEMHDKPRIATAAPAQGVVVQPPAAPPPAAVAATKAAPKEPEPLSFSAAQQREYDMVVRLAADIKEKSFYQRLGLNPGATHGQIYQRYWQLAEVYHPDRVAEPHLRTLRHELATIAACLQQAYGVLNDPDKRAQHDIGVRTVPPGEIATAEELRRRDQQREAEAKFYRAKDAARRGDLTGAMALLDQAVRFNPQVDALLWLAKLESANPNWADRVLDRLRMAVSVDPESAEAWLELSKQWAARGDTAQQRACLEKILEIEPNHIEARAGLEKLGRLTPA